MPTSFNETHPTASASLCRGARARGGIVRLLVDQGEASLLSLVARIGLESASGAHSS